MDIDKLILPSRLMHRSESFGSPMDIDELIQNAIARVLYGGFGSLMDLFFGCGRRPYLE